MRYENEVYRKMELVNSVFKSLNIASLEANKNFTIDALFHQEHYVKFLLRKSDSINFDFYK